MSEYGQGGDPPSDRPTRIQLAGRIALATWMLLVVIGVGSLMVSHHAPLPVPDAGARGALARGLRALIEDEYGSASAPEWVAVHVLYDDCPCSQRAARHLLKGGRPAGVTEFVLVVGDTQESPLVHRCSGAGFGVTRVTTDELESRFGIVAAPLFVVVEGGDQVRLVSGYTSRKQGPDYRDAGTIAAVAAGDQPTALPVYGCGTSSLLRRSLDPLGLKE